MTSKYQYNYETERAKNAALHKLNRGEADIAEMQQMLKSVNSEKIDKLLNDARLCFVYARTVFFGRGKGKTGGIKK